MKKLVRFGVSLDQHLLKAFDRHIQGRKYTNRSEALRDLIRDNLVGQAWDQNEETVGTITFVYDHHVRDLTRKLTHIQHGFQGHIMAGMHVHLDHAAAELAQIDKPSSLRKGAPPGASESQLMERRSLLQQLVHTYDRHLDELRLRLTAMQRSIRKSARRVRWKARRDHPMSISRSASMAG